MNTKRTAISMLLATTCSIFGCDDSGDSQPQLGSAPLLESRVPVDELTSREGEVDATVGVQEPGSSVQEQADARDEKHIDPSMSEVAVTSASKPGVTRKLINKVARGPGAMYQVYDLEFDYDMTRISDGDYQYLVEQISQAQAVQDAANRQSQYQNAYDAATSGEATFSFNFDAEAIFSTPQARLDTLKRIIDEARSQPSN